MALLGVVASISVLGRQREEDCHRFEARQAPYSQRGGDTVLCESTCAECRACPLTWLLEHQGYEWPMLMPDTEVGAGNPDSGLILAWQALDSVTQFPTPKEIFPWRRSKHVKAFITSILGFLFPKLISPSILCLREQPNTIFIKGMHTPYPSASWTFDAWLSCT